MDHPSEVRSPCFALLISTGERHGGGPVAWFRMTSIVDRRAVTLSSGGSSVPRVSQPATLSGSAAVLQVMPALGYPSSPALARLPFPSARNVTRTSDHATGLFGILEPKYQHTTFRAGRTGTGGPAPSAQRQNPVFPDSFCKTLRMTTGKGPRTKD